MPPKKQSAVRRAELYSMESGASRSDEDTWTLVYDPDGCDIFVEHWWSYVFGPNAGTGSKRIELKDFLKSKDDGVRQLKDRLERIFRD